MIEYLGVRLVAKDKNLVTWIGSLVSSLERSQDSEIAKHFHGGKMGTGQLFGVHFAEAFVSTCRTVRRLY